MHFKHASLRGGFVPPIFRPGHPARMGNAILCMATVNVTHETKPHFFSQEIAFPKQPMTSPFEKGAHQLKKEVLNKNWSQTPPYMLGRDYQASARSVDTTESFGLH